MNPPNHGPKDPRLWVLLALEAAKHLIPILQRELGKRWKRSNPNQKEKS